MGLRDDDFPGRNDKLIWVLVLLSSPRSAPGSSVPTGWPTGPSPSDRTIPMQTRRERPSRLRPEHDDRGPVQAVALISRCNRRDRPADLVLERIDRQTPRGAFRIHAGE